MARYQVTGLIAASVYLGEYEAASEDEAIKKAELDPDANWNPSLCWHCAHEIDIGDVYETVADEL